MGSRSIPIDCPECGRTLEFDESEDFKLCRCGGEVRREEAPPPPGSRTSRTLSFRVPLDVAALLEREAKDMTLSDLLRDIVVDHVSGMGPERGVNGRKPHEGASQGVSGCPIIEACVGGFYCPHLRKSFAGDGGSVLPSSRSRSAVDPLDELLDNLSHDERSVAMARVQPLSPPSPGPELDFKPRVDRENDR